MGILIGLWQKLWGYVIVVVGVMAAFGMTYLRGKNDAKREAERQALERDLETRREADAIRDGAASVPDPVVELRTKWSRPGR